MVAGYGGANASMRMPAILSSGQVQSGSVGSALMELPALLLLAAGGAAYLVGTAFFVFDTSLRFGHFIWHLFVMAGSGCHLAAALA